MVVAHNMVSRFFVLQVMTGEEARFIDLARQTLMRLDTGSSEIRLWWPRRKLLIRRRGRRLSSLAPLFPGYVFLEAEDITDAVFRALRGCRGFVRFLLDNRDIRPLLDADLELIRHFLSFGEIVQPSRVEFDIENRIVVRDGPLKGLEGQIVKVDKRKRRAKVRLDMYEDSFFIDLGFEIMEPRRKETDVAS